MNDLDLRMALQRDADLAGSPAPDLLEQLVQRRGRQRRQRAGFITAGLVVAVIAVGVPMGASFMTRSDGGPAAETTVDPTPSVTPEVVAPTPTAVPPARSVAPVPEPVVEAPEPAVQPACPDLDTLRAALPADTADHRITMSGRGDPVCSGSWAAAGYSESRLFDGQWMDDGQAGLFRFLDGSWTWLDRYTSDVCSDQEMPDAVWQRGCNVD